MINNGKVKISRSYPSSGCTAFVTPLVRDARVKDSQVANYQKIICSRELDCRRGQVFHLLTRTVKDRAWEGGSELPLLERQREYQLREEMSSGVARLEKMRWGRGKLAFQNCSDSSPERFWWESEPRSC